MRHLFPVKEVINTVKQNTPTFMPLWHPVASQYSTPVNFLAANTGLTDLLLDLDVLDARQRDAIVRIDLS